MVYMVYFLGKKAYILLMSKIWKELHRTKCYVIILEQHDENEENYYLRDESNNFSSEIH